MARTEFPRPVSSRRRYGISRVDYEQQVLMMDLYENPGEWAIYSKHCSISSAGGARRDAQRKPPRVIAKYSDHLEWKSVTLPDEGPVCLVRWVTAVPRPAAPGTAPASS